MPFRGETWEHEWARLLYIMIVILSAITMAILFVLIQNDRKDIRKEATIRATQIQQQRYDTFYQACVDQNRRNRRTIRRTKQLIKQNGITDGQAKEQFMQTKFLIDALAPTRNCKVVAAESVHPLANPNGR